MKLAFCSSQGIFVVDHFTAGDAVWMVINTPTMTIEKFMQRFPDAKPSGLLPERHIAYFAIDEELK